MTRKLLLTMRMIVGLTMGFSNQARALTVTDTIFDRKMHEQDFAFGADVSFVSQMESWNTVWRNKAGVAKDILEILKEQGINNVRLRVWVNPGGGTYSYIFGKFNFNAFLFGNNALFCFCCRCAYKH